MRKEGRMPYTINTKKDKKKHKTKLHDLMVEKRISITKLAELSGLERPQISNMVSGLQTNMHLDNAKKICNALGTSLDETFGEGVVDLKNKLLTEIEDKIKKLDERDAEGHLWYNKFKDMVLNLKN